MATIAFLGGLHFIKKLFEAFFDMLGHHIFRNLSFELLVGTILVSDNFLNRTCE